VAAIRNPSPSASESVIEFRGVSKRFGERLAVQDLDLQVPRGQCFGLLGPNGAGKTTSLRMVYGVARPTSGRVSVFGIDVSLDPRAVRARLGVTLQENALVEALTPAENLRVFGRYHLMREPELSRRAEELVELFELGDHARTPARFLSGGLQRRLAIALSLMNRPELLVLDEPTTGLDPQARLSLWSRVRELRAAGTTILLTTHYMEEAERLCDRLAIMAHGRVRAEGSPSELVRRHLAREALETELDPSEEASLAGWLPPHAPRLRAGRRLTLYVEDAAALAQQIRGRDGGDRRPLVVRPANLEDVFLALTGASLEIDE